MKTVLLKPAEMTRSSKIVYIVYMMRPAKDLNNGPIFSKCCALLTEGGVRTPYLDQMGSI